MAKFDVILFDLDGTLVNSMEGITRGVQYALSKFGIEVEDRNELTSFIGPPLLDSFMKYFGFSKEDAEKAVFYYREYYRPIGVMQNSLYEGMEEMLKDLKSKGKTLVVATAKPTEFACRVIESFNLTDCFDMILGSEFDGRRTNKTECIAEVLSSIKCDKSKTAMVGDKDSDVIGGLQNGIAGIGVLYGFGSYEEITSCGATYVCETVGDLHKLLTE